MKTKAYIIKILIPLAAMLLMIFSFTACTYGDVNRYTLPQVTVGDTFEITLDAHGGTAYSWDYSVSPSNGIEYVTQEYIPANGASDGIGGGQLKYTFKAIKAGNYKIKFELQISWESEPPIETNIYKITVTK